MRDADGVNLSGVWHGVYNYPVNRPPVPFVATLIETDTWLAGETTETSTRARDAGAVLIAQLDGRRTGRAVKFVKFYKNFHDTGVQYAGTLNDDATEIDGRWTIPGNWSGTFLMIRDKPLAAARTLEAVERL
jgi:hypothetical protein